MNYCNQNCGVVYTCAVLYMYMYSCPRPEYERLTSDYEWMKCLTTVITLVNHLYPISGYHLLLHLRSKDLAVNLINIFGTYTCSLNTLVLHDHNNLFYIDHLSYNTFSMLLVYVYIHTLVH